MRCLLIGNYGTGNFGDEALRSYFLKHFPEIEWKVVSAAPKGTELPRLPAGIRSLFTTNWLHTLRTLRNCDAVVFGGGTLFTDSESVFACFLWWIHVRAAGMFRKPVLFAFQGVGPFRTFIAEWFARDALRRGSFLSVRDAASEARVEAWNLNTKFVQSFDPIYKEMINQIGDSSQNVFDEKNAAEMVLVVIPRANPTPDFYTKYRTLCSSGSFDRVRIISLQSEDSVEDAVCNKLELDSPYPCQRLAAATVHELLRSLAPADAVLSQRYHGSLAAIAFGKKLILVQQAEGDKHAELEKYVHDTTAREHLPELIRSGEIALTEALNAV